MTLTVSQAYKDKVLSGTNQPVHAVADPGKVLLSFNTMRVLKEGNQMQVLLCMDKELVAHWEIPAVDFDNEEIMVLAGFIGNTQIAVETH